MKVLVTGAAGYVGCRLCPSLSLEHEVRHGDLRPPTGGVGEWVGLDVRSPEECRAACRGVDAVVHLAVASGHEGDFEDEEFNRLRFETNVIGTWNLFEAARLCGVRRVIHTSSLMVVWGYGPGESVTPDSPPRPVGTYALTKLLAEQVARHYSGPDLTVACLRIAKPVETAPPRRIRPQWIAFPELCRAYALALNAGGPEFGVAHLVGESSRRRWDLTAAGSLFGYRPELRLEDLGFTLDEDAPLG